MSDSTSLQHKSWIEVSEKALKHNFKIFRDRLSHSIKVLSVVKANAYGHGIKCVSKILDESGTDWFGVDSVGEALEVRGLTNKPILTLGYLTNAGIREALENDISFVVYNLETLREIESVHSRNSAKIHIKLETGTNRQGVTTAQLDNLLDGIKKSKANIRVEGVYTHLANVEDTLDPSFALRQLELFETLSNRGEFQKSLKHVAATGATLLHHESNFDMVRVGIGLYGLWPSREVQIASKERGTTGIELKPVLSWKSVVAQVKNISSGETVGYGRSWRAPRDSVIAVIPVGYYDGYDRKLSNNSRVLMNGRSANIVGRVAMNMITVDITDIGEVAVGNEVVLIGNSGEEQMGAEELADRMGTINYEVVSRINPLIPRIVM